MYLKVEIKAGSSSVFLELVDGGVEDCVREKV